MTQKEILEGNKLIAEFMGFKKYNPDRSRNLFIATPEKLAYERSWDWLMPVVEKINKLNLSVIISADSCKIEAWDDSIPSENFAFINKFVNKFKDYIFVTTYYKSNLKNGANSLQEAVYKAIVEFINWYNKNN